MKSNEISAAAKCALGVIILVAFGCFTGIIKYLIYKAIILFYVFMFCVSIFLVFNTKSKK